jgi:hypothetical protein
MYFRYVFAKFEPATDLILVQDANKVLHKFSAVKYPNVYRAITAFEALQTAWETKLASNRYSVYHNALHDGLGKLHKYYNKFDQKPAFLLALGESFQYLPYSLLTVVLVLHPYFKLEYIKKHWGGEEEQKREIANGNLNARNWQNEALQVVERIVSILFHFIHINY